MNDENQPIPSAPIIEAVVDIDCDLPPKLNLHGLREAAEDALRIHYPKFRQQLVQQHEQMALDGETGNRVNIVKTTELPQGDKLPLILDIDVFYPCETPPSDWQLIRERLDSLRSLKNRIFRNTLTQQCLNLFSPQV